MHRNMDFSWIFQCTIEKIQSGVCATAVANHCTVVIIPGFGDGASRSLSWVWGDKEQEWPLSGYCFEQKGVGLWMITTI
ncbi:MAG: hypothetical protein IAE79_06910 [Anaerolinea sp.]|nr:hypothetical protein [Anaerolinea sp.]